MASLHLARHGVAPPIAALCMRPTGATRPGSSYSAPAWTRRQMRRSCAWQTSPGCARRPGLPSCSPWRSPPSSSPCPVGSLRWTHPKSRPQRPPPARSTQTAGCPPASRSLPMQQHPRRRLHGASLWATSSQSRRRQRMPPLLPRAACLPHPFSSCRRSFRPTTAASPIVSCDRSPFGRSLAATDSAQQRTAAGWCRAPCRARQTRTRACPRHKTASACNPSRTASFAPCPRNAVCGS
mmetsp:Transcript_26607/g.76662  ORF Transcript_26607/g.76662 Transcript_26607/m.76662 type:complete len:238 (-) Transcript_26607:184-897(-)